MQAILLGTWLMLFASLPAMAATPPAQSATKTTAAITSTEALARYLRESSEGTSPLDLLPPGAKKRFLRGLQFGTQGLTGFSTTDLQAELTDDEIRQVLALFGAQEYAATLHGIQHRAGSLRKPPCGTPTTCPESRIEQHFNQFSALAEAHTPDESNSTKARKLAASYRALFAAEQPSARLRSMSDGDLNLLYRAADIASSWSPDAPFLHDLTQAFHELQQRGLATDQQVVQLHTRLVTAREFAAADALAGNYPAAGLLALPTLREQVKPDHDGPSMLTLSANEKELLHRPFDLHGPVQIVVVAGCHFAADAARDIHADPALDRIFTRHALWLGSQSENIDDVRQWNRDHPGQSMNIAWRDSEWQMLDSWAMPTFYLFRNGRLVTRFGGWARETGTRQLRAALRQAGLLD